MMRIYSSIISRNPRISTPPPESNPPPPPRPADDPLSHYAIPTRSEYLPTGRTSGAAMLFGVSQPSPEFEPPPTACETRHVPFIYTDDTGLHYHLTNIYRVVVGCSHPRSKLR